MSVVVSSHTLNGVDGTHAGGIAVKLVRLNAAGGPDIIFTAETDEGGRMVQEVALSEVHTDANYELIFETEPYWDTQELPSQESRILKQVVIRFEMPDPAIRYHIPVILSPNSYSVWWPSA